MRWDFFRRVLDFFTFWKQKNIYVYSRFIYRESFLSHFFISFDSNLFLLFWLVFFVTQRFLSIANMPIPWSNSSNNEFNGSYWSISQRQIPNKDKREKSSNVKDGSVQCASPFHLCIQKKIIELYNVHSSLSIEIGWGIPFFVRVLHIASHSGPRWTDVTGV